VSGVVGIAGCLFLVSGSVELLPLGLALLLFFNLLDCVDGSIARTMRTENPYGRFLDSTCGGAIDLAFWGIIGIIAFQHQALLISPRALGYPPLLWLAIGAATCYLSILVGYIERTYSELLKADWDRIKSTKQEPAMKVARVVGLEAKPIFATTGRISGVIRIINNNLRVRETHYFLLLFAVNYRTIDLLLAVYLVYYLSHTLLLLVIYSKRGKIIRKLY
jgi:phosphatidylglycerophosphate synthase